MAALCPLCTDRAMTEGSTTGCNSSVIVHRRRGCWVLMEVDCFVVAGYALGQTGIYGAP